MNKEKVMQAVYELSDLQSICSKSMRQKAINKVENELNSKPVMPKVWTDWFETYNLPQDMMILELAKLYNGRIRDQLDVNLYNAIVSEDNSLTVWDCLNVIRSECEPSNV